MSVHHNQKIISCKGGEGEGEEKNRRIRGEEEKSGRRIVLCMCSNQIHRHKSSKRKRKEKDNDTKRDYYSYVYCILLFSFINQSNESLVQYKDISIHHLLSPITFSIVFLNTNLCFFFYS